MELNTPNQPRLSLLQMMKLVVFCAVALACVAPMLHLWQAGAVAGGRPNGLGLVALFEAVVVPLVWVGLSCVLIRRGSWRDGLITALLLCSVTTALGIACWLLFFYTIPAYGMPGAPPQDRVGVADLALHSLVILVLVGSALFLTFRLWRGSKQRPAPQLSLQSTPR